MRFALIATLALIASPALAEDDLEMAAALPETVSAAAASEDAFSGETMAAVKSVARQVAKQYRITPEKRAELNKLAAEQKKNIAPHVKAMGKAMEGFAKDPKFKADMERFAKDMQGMMARQLPQMLAALQPMIQEALPQLLEAQAKALRTLTLPTPVDPYEDQ